MIVNYAKDFLRKATSIFVVRKINTRKSQLKDDYSSSPKTTAIIQCFNKKHNVAKILHRITPIFDETIVIDDGSVDGSLPLLSKCLTGRNEFLIRSNDLYEVVMYNRAINFSRGEIICLLQDDDIPPADDAWLGNALLLFDKYPDLHILGGKNGLDILPRASHDDQNAMEPAAGVKTVKFPGVNHYHFFHKPMFLDMSLGIPFMFSVAINRAPMFIRKEAFLAAGGIDQSFRPFQCDDVDACLRAWERGGQVGLYDAPFHRNVGMGGMRLYNKAKVGTQAQKNWDLIYDRYMASINNRAISEKVSVLNAKLLSPRTG